ncbi:MAG: glycosyltransferase [Leptospiraceae bacterium]|nr:glycosyltransferase [Leptospiraceae bacterium]
MKVFQHVDEFSLNDGIGNDILGIDNTLKSLGYESYIVCRKSNINQENLIKEFPTEIRESSKDVHILHYGGYGYPIQEFEKLKGKKILRFHNYTPSFFFKRYIDKEMYNSFANSELKAKIELESILFFSSRVWCDSSFNLSTLFSNSAQYKKSKERSIVIPIVRNYQRAEAKDFLSYEVSYIGRFSCHKKIEDILCLFFFLRKIDPRYKLKLIGKKIPAFQNYTAYLLDIIKKLKLEDSIQIFENIDEHEKIKELYRSDFLISMSEHEGFGIPAMEALHLGVMNFCYSLPTFLETLGDSALLFQEKKFLFLAELLNKINTSFDIRNKILNNMKERMKFHSQLNFAEILKDELELRVRKF